MQIPYQVSSVYAIGGHSYACRLYIFGKIVFSEILTRMLTILRTDEEYCRRIGEAKEAAGTSLVSLLTLTYPIVAEAQVKLLEELKVGKGIDGKELRNLNI
jgi:hypothetical protein